MNRKPEPWHHGPLNDPVPPAGEPIWDTARITVHFDRPTDMLTVTYHLRNSEDTKVHVQQIPPGENFTIDIPIAPPSEKPEEGFDDVPRTDPGLNFE